MDAARQLPKPVLDALTSRAQNDPVFLSLMARIQAGTASLTDNFQFLYILNQVTLEQFGRATQQTADLSSFHQAHFGQAAIAVFATDFLDPSKTQQHPGHQPEGDEIAYYEEGEEFEEDDGLGYYPDGVKRTLTDEQIAMFRHSEIQALLKSREKAQPRRNISSESSTPIPMELEDAMSEEGELADEVSPQVVAAKKKKNNNKNKNKKKKRGSGNSNAKRQYSPDPERRKRTWDVVDTGLDGLDYGETEQAQTKLSPARQRRRITYEEG
ncbi:hypothetical protein VMCG_03586 [Cytospora schulzeri]|uniref:Uncharacterized protein n=1 Tax=Cytospora schulzeri TaxID=448051 RepID=A0A423WWD5_9PEZI|nr:hypothetical protein VMCG_03586 [Valsa malicola]